MGLDDDMSELQNRRKALYSRRDQLTTDATQLDADVSALSTRVKGGESTGDRVKDYVLATGKLVHQGKSVAQVVDEKTRDIRERIAWFTSGEVHRINDCRGGKIVRVGAPVYEIPSDYSGVHLKVTDGVAPRTKKLGWFKVDVPYLDTVGKIDIATTHLSSYTVKQGWDAIKSEYERDPEVLAMLLDHFSVEVPDDLRVLAHAQEDKRTIEILQELDERVRSAKHLWDEVEKKRQRREELKKKQSGMRGSPVLGIRDQLNRDSVEMELDMMIFKGPCSRDHDRATNGLVRSIENVLEIGLHEYPRDVSIEHRQGKKTVYEVANYVREIAARLEVLLTPVS